jgi:hypothetical protein
VIKKSSDVCLEQEVNFFLYLNAMPWTVMRIMYVDLHKVLYSTKSGWQYNYSIMYEIF